ncbi:T9SS type A sorting domain-containing protein [candidate division WOR-3 bacterium]|nr:T9SS type A sorting domain-containing protein [candidate division WOR-3 bacterium]
MAFTIGTQAHVNLKVYDRTGRLVEQLVNRPLPAGTNVVSWNAANVANGVYFLQLDVEGQTDTYKMIVIK